MLQAAMAEFTKLDTNNEDFLTTSAQKSSLVSNVARQLNSESPGAGDFLDAKFLDTRIAEPDKTVLKETFKKTMATRIAKIVSGNVTPSGTPNRSTPQATPTRFTSPARASPSVSTPSGTPGATSTGTPSTARETLSGDPDYYANKEKEKKKRKEAEAAMARKQMADMNKKPGPAVVRTPPAAVPARGASSSRSASPKPSLPPNPAASAARPGSPSKVTSSGSTPPPKAASPPARVSSSDQSMSPGLSAKKSESPEEKQKRRDAKLQKELVDEQAQEREANKVKAAEAREAADAAAASAQSETPTDAAAATEQAPQESSTTTAASPATASSMPNTAAKRGCACIIS